MRSASPRSIRRLATVAACGALLAGVATGCATTQETAAQKQAESKRFLEQREKHRAQKKSHAQKEKR